MPPACLTRFFYFRVNIYFQLLSTLLLINEKDAIFFLQFGENLLGRDICFRLSPMIAFTWSALTSGYGAFIAD